LEEEGLPALYKQLQEVDPETAGRLAPGDRQRVLRALEVYATSGRPLSEWIRDKPFGVAPLAARKIGLTLPRSILYDRISHRAEEMVQRGWTAEVRTLLESGVAAESPAFQAIGYREMVRHIAGELTLEEAIATIVRFTRRYAKRQMTWFRRERDVRWVSALKQPDLSMLLTASEWWRTVGGNEQT
jgi:tRNA dimethylallyltransferase